MQLLRPITLLAVLACAAILHGCNRPADGPALYPVRINNTTWMVELAITPDDQHRGLAGRDLVPEGRGMLFVYDRPQEDMVFWMKGCSVPLDIAFIGADRRIVKIYTMACEPPEIRFNKYPANAPAQFALEVPAGAFAKAGVKVNDTVILDPKIPLTTQATTTSGR